MEYLDPTIRSTDSMVPWPSRPGTACVSRSTPPHTEGPAWARRNTPTSSWAAGNTASVWEENPFLSRDWGGVGGANKNWPANNAIGQTASFAALLGGGLDTPLTRHITFRVSGGYQYSYFALDHPLSLVPYRIPGLPTNFGRISSGLVWQF